MSERLTLFFKWWGWAGQGRVGQDTGSRATPEPAGRYLRAPKGVPGAELQVAQGGALLRGQAAQVLNRVLHAALALLHQAVPRTCRHASCYMCKCSFI